MPRGKENNNGQQVEQNDEVKKQLKEREKKYFAAKKALPQQQAELQEQAEQADEMQEHLKQQLEELNQKVGERKKQLLGKLSFKNFRNKMEKEGCYDWGTKDPSKEYLGHSDTLKLFFNCKKTLENKTTVELTEEDVARIKKEQGVDLDAFGFDGDELDVAAQEAEYYKIVDKYLDEKAKKIPKKTDQEILTEVISQLQMYIVSDMTAPDKKKKLREKEQHGIEEVIDYVKDSIEITNEIENYDKLHPNTAKESYEQSVKEFEDKKKYLDKELEDIIAEYDKNGLDRSHLDGSKEHKEQTYAIMQELLEKGSYGPLLDMMLDIKEKAAKEDSTRFEKAEAKAVDELIETFTEVKEGKMTERSEEIHKNFLIQFGGRDEEKLHKDPLYTELRSKIRFNPQLKGTKAKDGRDFEEFAKDTTKLGKDLKNLSNLSEEELNNNSVNAEAGKGRIDLYMNRVSEIAKSAQEIIKSLDALKKGKKNTTEYDEMRNALGAVAELDGSKSPQEIATALDTMKKTAKTYEEKRSSPIKFTKVGRERLKLSKKIDQLFTQAQFDELTTLSGELKSKNMKINEQLQAEQDQIDFVKNEKERRIEEAKRIEREKKAAAEAKQKKAELNAGEHLQDGLDAKRKEYDKDKRFSGKFFRRLAFEASKSQNKTIELNGGAFKLLPKDEFTYTYKDATIHGAFDKEYDDLTVYPERVDPEKGKQHVAEFRKKHDQLREVEAAFRLEARKRLLKDLGDDKKKLFEIEKKQKKEHKEYGFGSYEHLSNGQVHLEKGKINYLSGSITIEKFGEKFTRDNIKIKAEYDKNGLIMDDSLKLAQKELDKEKAAQAEKENKKDGNQIGM